MEKFYYEEPSLERREDAIEFIKEFYEADSPINGTGGLQRFLDDYEGWLRKLENDYNTIPDEERVPAKTYFFVREDDKKIVGMINIRLALNERLRNSSGNIGYSIRPSERRKGYNKINLYLGLKTCKEFGLDKVLLDAEINNIGSIRSIEALDGVLLREGMDYEGDMVKFFEIDTNMAINNHKDVYEEFISKMVK